MLKKIKICQLSPMLDTNMSYNEAETRCPYLLLSCWDKTLTRSNLRRKGLISSYSAKQQLDIRETPGRSLSAGTEAGTTEHTLNGTLLITVQRRYLMKLLCLCIYGHTQAIECLVRGQLCGVDSLLPHRVSGSHLKSPDLCGKHLPAETSYPTFSQFICILFF